MEIERLEKAIETLEINKACCELDKSNGVSSKNSDDFIDACGIAVSYLEYALEELKDEKRRPLIELKERNTDFKRIKKLKESKDIGEILTELFNELRRFYGISDTSMAKSISYNIEVNKQVLSLRNEEFYNHSTEEGLGNLVKKWYNNQLEKMPIIDELDKSVGHSLKVIPGYFNDIESGKRTFEIRKNDRNYQVGDKLILKEWENNKYTGRMLKKEIIYMLDDHSGYVMDGDVVMGFK